MGGTATEAEAVEAEGGRLALEEIAPGIFCMTTEGYRVTWDEAAVLQTLRLARELARRQRD